MLEKVLCNHWHGSQKPQDQWTIKKRKEQEVKSPSPKSKHKKWLSQINKEDKNAHPGTY